MFPFPRQRRHLDLALQMVNRFEVVPERQKRLVRWAVEYFLTNGSARNAHITFRDKASLKKFVRVLEILKVFAPVRRHDEWTELPRYQLWLVMPFEDGSEERKVAWEFWNRGVSLYPFQSKNKVAAAGAEFGRIELCVLALKGRSQPKKNSKRRHHQPSDWGFRLGLYLLAFAYGWRNDTTAM